MHSYITHTVLSFPPSTVLAVPSTNFSSDAAPAVRKGANVTNPVQSNRGLKDQDRIFTNLYNHSSFHLEDALKRGDWYQTKEMMNMGREWIINEVKASG